MHIPNGVVMAVATSCILLNVCAQCFYSVPDSCLEHCVGFVPRYGTRVCAALHGCLLLRVWLMMFRELCSVSHAQYPQLRVCCSVSSHWAQNFFSEPISSSGGLIVRIGWQPDGMRVELYSSSPLYGHKDWQNHGPCSSPMKEVHPHLSH